MDASTISALAAWAAAGVAATGATFQFFIGRKQGDAALTSANAALKNAQNAGRHTIAEFRQKWIDKVIDVLSEHHAILMATPIGQTIPAAEHQNLSSLRTKLEILLNPNEPDTVALLSTIDDVAMSTTEGERTLSNANMVSIARRLLKAEWERIKKELE